MQLQEQVDWVVGSLHDEWEPCVRCERWVVMVVGLAKRVDCENVHLPRRLGQGVVALPPVQLQEQVDWVVGSL